MKYLSISLLIFIVGCSCPEQVTKTEFIIKNDTLRIIVPQDSLFDTIYVNNLQGESVKYIVKVDTLWKKVMVKGKTDTIRVIVRDTVTINETKIVKSDDWTFEDKFWAVLTILGVILLITVLRK